MTPCVMLLSGMGLITPLYSGYSLPGGLHVCSNNQWFFHEDCCSQGMPTGVLWPLLGCLVVDAFIASLSEGGIYIQGYGMTLVFLQ